jgi:hypothetical protein
MRSASELDREKQRRLYENFLDDIRDLIPFLEDRMVTDLFVGGRGELIVKRFGTGKEFTGIFFTS